MNLDLRKPIVLAGDIGGTKTNMGLFQMGKSRPVLKTFETYSSRDASGLEDIIDRFIRRHPASIAGACFGIAGPIINGVCKTTNLPWIVSEKRIEKRFKWNRVCLINDLSATAQAIPTLKSREIAALNKARIRKRENIALIAPGTGLGMASLVYNGKEYVPGSSEGGHADFAPNTKSEAALWESLYERFGHVSIERVLSGPGLVNIYSWLRETGRYKEPSWLAQRLNNDDPARVISDVAIRGRNALCRESMKMFVSIFSAAAGNFALTGMTTGGVYLGGGIPPQLLPLLKNGLFMKGFQNKGRFREMMEKIAVKVILNDKAALLGAAKQAFTLIDSKLGG